MRISWSKQKTRLPNRSGFSALWEIFSIEGDNFLGNSKTTNQRPIRWKDTKNRCRPKISAIVMKIKAA
jgi:hypothetical protein